MFLCATDDLCVNIYSRTSLNRLLRCPLASVLCRRYGVNNNEEPSRPLIIPSFLGQLAYSSTPVLSSQRLLGKTGS